MTDRLPQNLDLDPNSLGSVTDLYQLTMMAGYFAHGIDQTPAVFEIFVRRLPKGRSHLIFAGLEQALEALTRLRFNSDQVDWLRNWPVFAGINASFFDRLASFQFTGDVWAIPEGTVFFANEPILRVSGPIAQAQIVETLLLAMLGYPTSVATKASRIVMAAKGRGVIDFGARRGHGLQASMIAARSAYLAGFLGTSQVEAARRLAIPAFGTMAHSWVQAFGNELDAFRAFAATYPGTTLLVDTYDTTTGVKNAVKIDPPVRAIRIDSGDLNVAARQARDALDSADRQEIRILVSGDLDEWKIANLIEQGSPIDEFGVGTELINCGDEPSLSLVYKLCEVAGSGTIKLSQGKQSLPYAKQIVRRTDSDGRFVEDHLVRADEAGLGHLLNKVMDRGRIISPLPDLNEIREYCRAQQASLPPRLKTLEVSAPGYPVLAAKSLTRESERLARLIQGG